MLALLRVGGISHTHQQLVLRHPAHPQFRSYRLLILRNTLIQQFPDQLHLLLKLLLLTLARALETLLEEVLMLQHPHLLLKLLFNPLLMFPVFLQALAPPLEVKEQGIEAPLYKLDQQVTPHLTHRQNYS